MLKKFSIESLLVMFLFIIFTACIGILIIQGRTSYEAIIDQKNDTEAKRIAYAYIDKKVKQNDRLDAIAVVDNPYNEYGGIQITHSGEETGYFTTLFYEKDGLYEVMTAEGESIQIELGEKIISLQDPILISIDAAKQLILLNDNTDNRTVIHVSSKVVLDHE